MSKVSLADPRQDKACLYGLNPITNFYAGVLFVCLEIFFISSGVAGVLRMKYGHEKLSGVL